MEEDSDEDEDEDEEDEVKGEDEDDAFAFPAPDLDTRYADLSDDDMDDVYADFGVLFGGGGSGSESASLVGHDISGFVSKSEHEKDVLWE